MNRRDVLRAASAAAVAAASPLLPAASQHRPPNFIIVLCDDLGFGDVGALGAKRMRTPVLDRMAREGTVLTDFYSAANLCTPSRAGLLTGRYPIRTGLAYEVIMQNDRRGLDPAEVTLAEALKPEYATAFIGKWHLGHVAPYWPPTRQGFDLFFGLPYSHDMQPLSLYEAKAPGVEITSEDVDFPRLQQRFFERAAAFVEQNRDRPFLVELALSAPHLPNHPDAAHAGHSDAGIYGDVVEEIDAGVGRLLAQLRRLGLDRDTLVIFTSDNGPWYEGSAGSHRGRKGGAGYDGGYRVPFIARQPGVLPAGRRVDSIAMSIDLLPTLCGMAGKSLPAGVVLDGLDIGAVLKRGARSPHEELVLFDNEKVAAIRTQRWKYVVGDYYRGFGRVAENAAYPQLYDMAAVDPEQYSVAQRYPGELADMRRRFARARETFEPLGTGLTAEAWRAAFPRAPARQD